MKLRGHNTQQKHVEGITQRMTSKSQTSSHLISPHIISYIDIYIYTKINLIQYCSTDTGPLMAMGSGSRAPNLEVGTSQAWQRCRSASLCLSSFSTAVRCSCAAQVLTTSPDTQPASTCRSAGGFQNFQPQGLAKAHDSYI